MSQHHFDIANDLINQGLISDRPHEDNDFQNDNQISEQNHVVKDNQVPINSDTVSVQVIDSQPDAAEAQNADEFKSQIKPRDDVPDTMSNQVKHNPADSNGQGIQLADQMHKQEKSAEKVTLFKVLH